MAELEVADRIATAGAHLTGAERRVAQAVLEHPHLVAFGTVADLATEAGAGAATVVRLAAKLGFDGFTALQASVQDDLSRQLRPAAERIRELADRPHVERHREITVTNVTETLDHISREGFDEVVGMLERPTSVRPRARRRGRARRGGAVRSRPRCSARRCRAVGGNDVAVRRQLALSTPRSTLIVIDLRRYEQWLLDAVKFADELEHTIVACTMVRVAWR